jgi:DNA-binding response OmpR family regulator
MKHVLIASDDAHTTAWVEAALDRLDATLERCGVAELAGRLAAAECDLLILDGGRVPARSLEAFERAAEDGAEARLMMLIEAEVLDDLRMPVRSASDFLVRGAASAELFARSRQLLWPGEEPAGRDVVRTGDLTVNLATYQAYIGDEPVEFTYLEYALVSFLVTHPNRVYGRDVLLSRVWGSDYFGGARTVDVHVRRVRAKLGPEHSRRLETVRSVGYLWRG